MFLSLEKAIDKAIESEQGQKRARKALQQLYEKIMNRKDTEFAAWENIDRHIMMKHERNGTMKFPVKDADGSVRMVDFRDLKAKEAPKNQKP